MSHNPLPMLRKIQFYQESILGLRNILYIYGDKVIEENTEFFLDGSHFDDEYQISRAIGSMLHMVQLDMKEYFETYKDYLEQKDEEVRDE